MRILLFTNKLVRPGHQNVGDRVILEGVKSLLRGAFDSVTFEEVDRWSECSIEPDEFELIVYAGMPQFGARAELAMEEAHFNDLAVRARRAKVMNLGGGTGFVLGHSRRRVARGMVESFSGRFYRTQRGVRLRTVRDRISKMFFDMINVPCHLMCCPSFFAVWPPELTAGSRGAFAVINDGTFVTDQYQGSIRELIARVRALLPADYELVAHCPEDCQVLEELGLSYVRLSSEKQLIDYYRTLHTLVSFRVHGAIPAWAGGTRVALGGFDGRIHMIDDVRSRIPWVNMHRCEPENLVRLAQQSRHHRPMKWRQRYLLKRFESYVKLIRKAYFG